MYLLVEFTDDKEMAVVPDIWQDGTSCALWPPFKSSNRIMNAVIQKAVPSDSWKSFPVKELYRNESYEKVRKKMKLAEHESDLQTAISESESDEDTTHRRSKRKRRTRVFSSDDEEDDARPPVRKLPVPPSVMQLTSSVSSASQNVTSSSVSSASSLPSLQPLHVQTSTDASSRNTYRSPVRLQQVSALSPASSPVPPSTSSSQEEITTRQPSNRPLQQVSLARDLRLFTTLEKIKEEQVQQRAMLQSILQLLQKMPNSASSERNELPEEVSFPLQTVEMMDDLEDKLIDRSVCEGIINYLSVLGGKDVGDTVRRILKHITSNHLAERYNWYGKKGKLKFGHLNMSSVIYKAARKTMKHVTQNEVEIVTREWLRTASDRDGGRKRREKRSTAPSSAEVDSL